ncbi:hypothetical protein A6046_06545 [[Haemophilus] ducreyi]|uniref:Excinuclease ABC subunit A n=2 Tax=Haemophilus ducreyi TaxID=730 RepID=Q7VNF4_HAEDU|nr:hypothetical protein [[Haemophilus] ducreyi]AAP95525.1 hypothetical protein HD_0595 [[Haemophilus] ducreyi 35000HP]AKO30612.1 hypothetical protein RY60_02315 [[Haemophilus] ducreyi]AKO32049.1 hypothetical protein RZ57_02320 [[Haemophilus] ducreyi]AKO33505.1 hypothetical protein RZ58_02325 [[Haemophilus] ducreyi]AKO34951.1 hypothetical protein RZ59_02305 [[Haemophilus] ducreyi]
MKLVKFVPALLSLVLTACASNDMTSDKMMAHNEQMQMIEQQAIQMMEPVMAETMAAIPPVNVEKITDGSKVVVYTCQNNKMITARYAFQGNNPKAVNLVLSQGKHTKQINGLSRDENNHDFTSFKSDKYVWNVENGFNLENAATKVGGMLTEKGAESDAILAKLCDVETTATKQANK